MKGYNDMNTNAPHPFVTEGSIVLSGAGRKPQRNKMWDNERHSMPSIGQFEIDQQKVRTMDMKPEDWARMRKYSNGRKTIGRMPVDQGYYVDLPRRNVLKGAGMDYDSDSDMEGAGFFDEVKKGYNKTKKFVGSETGQKFKKALMEDKAFMKEFNKAKKQLMDYQNGVRKTKPGKAAMIILEQSGVISKIEDEFKGGVNRLKKANRWRDFSDDTLRKGIDTGRYGYEQYREAVYPVQTELKNAAKKGIKGFTKMFGGAQSPWIGFVKEFSQKHNIPYKEALSKAGPAYRQIKSQM
jgi:hypothetical protein